MTRERLIQPLPWSVEKRSGGLVSVVDANDITVFNGVTFDEAVFIARACNAHADLLAALRAIVEHEQIDGIGIRYEFDWNSQLGKQARAAIAKATT